MTALLLHAAAPPHEPAPVDSMYPLLEAFAGELVAAGVEHVCLCPGARSTPLTVTLARTRGLRAWSHVDERSAAFFALGVAKTTRRPAVVVCTSGTAAANFFPAVIEAAHARVPLLVLTADRPAESRDCGAPQTIDQIKLYGSYPRWFVEVGGAECGESYFRHLACRAAAVATADPAGPVHLNFPFREPLLPPAETTRVAAAPSAEAAPTVSFTRARLEVPPAALLPLAARMARAPRGLIVCGPADTDTATAEAIAALARAAGYPIVADATSQLRNGAHDRTHLVDAYEVLLRDPGFAAARAPQLVLRFGPLPTCKALRQWLDTARSAQIVVDSGGGWDDPLRGAVEHWQVDPTTFCRRLEQALSAADRGAFRPAVDWSDAWIAAGQRARLVLDQETRTTDTLFGGRVFTELAALLPSGATLYVGNSMPIRELELFWPTRDTAVRILCNRGANGIDGFLSSGLGAAASAGGPVVVVTGDLGFYHDMNGLLAAKRYAIPVLIVVLNNDGGGIFSRLPQRRLSDVFDEYFTTPHGLDFATAARLYDCAFARATCWNDFRVHVTAALAGARPCLVEVPIDDRRDRARHEAILRAAAGALL